MKKEIILCDNHQLYLESMNCCLERGRLHENHEVTLSSDFNALESLISKKTSVLVLNLVGLNIFDAIDQIDNLLQLYPELKIIVISINAEMKTIKKMFDKGIKCYLGKNTGRDEFLRALNHVLKGKVYINDDAKNALLNFICSVDDETEQKPSGREDLTTREKDVLHLICDGLRSKEIAEKLFISPHTVETHRRNIMLKFNINNSSRLVKFAIDHRLVKY